MLICKYVDENGSAAMLAAKRLAGVAPEVNLGEHTSHMSLQSANKAAHSVDMCPPKFKKKRFGHTCILPPHQSVCSLSLYL